MPILSPPFTKVIMATLKTCLKNSNELELPTLIIAILLWPSGCVVGLESKKYIIPITIGNIPISLIQSCGIERLKRKPIKLIHTIPENPRYWPNTICSRRNTLLTWENKTIKQYKI